MEIINKKKNLERSILLNNCIVCRCWHNILKISIFNVGEKISWKIRIYFGNRLEWYVFLIEVEKILQEKKIGNKNVFKNFQEWKRCVQLSESLFTNPRIRNGISFLFSEFRSVKWHKKQRWIFLFEMALLSTFYHGINKSIFFNF